MLESTFNINSKIKLVAEFSIHLKEITVKLDNIRVKFEYLTSKSGMNEYFQAIAG